MLELVDALHAKPEAIVSCSQKFADQIAQLFHGRSLHLPLGGCRSELRSRASVVDVWLRRQCQCIQPSRFAW